MNSITQHKTIHSSKISLSLYDGEDITLFLCIALSPKTEYSARDLGSSLYRQLTIDVRESDPTTRPEKVVPVSLSRFINPRFVASANRRSPKLMVEWLVH
jgi:hypothetical protein